MANHLSVAMIHAIVTLHQRGWSNRRIARELGVDRGAVARHLAGANAGPGDAPPRNPPPGSAAAAAGVADSKAATQADYPPPGSNADFTGVLQEPTLSVKAPNAAILPHLNPPPGSEGELPVAAMVVAGPPSTCEPFRAVIHEKVDQGLSGRRIYQDLVQEHGGGGVPSYDSIKRFLRHLRRTTPVPFRRMEVHQFTSLQEQNQHLAQWEQSVADTRIHGTTRQQVGRVFHELERAMLLPIPPERFPFFHEALRMVHRDGHVAVAQAYYSVPPEYVGRQVWVRWDAHLVKVFNHRHEQIAIHARQQAGRFATNREHLHPYKTSAVERGTSYLLRQAALLGPAVAAWSQAMLQVRGVEGVRVLVGLLALARQQPGCDLEHACQIAHSHHAYRLRAIRELLQESNAVGEQAPLEFLESHPIIRELHEYDALVKDALRGVEATIPACSGGTLSP